VVYAQRRLGYERQPYSAGMFSIRMCRWLPRKAIILLPFIVLTVLGVFFALAHLVVIVFRIPAQFDFQLPIRLIGLLLLPSGFALLGWFFTYRQPADVLVSTYVTFSKLGKRAEDSRRTEPLVIRGPYTYVRHPLYSIVVLLILGWWLLLDYSFLLISALLLLLWFSLVVAPFEERELRAIFGDDYVRYARRVPRIIPFTKMLGKAHDER